MNLLPVIQREFRACCRRPSTYWLRVVAAVGLAVAAAYHFLEFSTFSPFLRPNVGLELFQRLNLLAVLFLLAACVLLVAPSLGREKRDGTLGLLFLTPLGAREIVIAKTLFFALFIFSAWLAFLPIMDLPLTLGGVTFKDVAGAFCQSLNAILAGLAGGMLAASFCDSRTGSIVGGTLFALFFLGLTTLIHAFVLSCVFLGSLSPGQPASLWSVAGRTELWPATLWNWHWFRPWLSEVGSRYTVLVLAPAHFTRLVFVLVASLGGSLAVLGLSLLGASAILRRSWPEKPLNARRLRWRAALTTPRFALSWYRRKMRRALWRNPIGWLHQYSWKARLLKWGWVFLLGMVLSDGFTATGSLGFFWLLGSLAATMAFAAVNSFQRERVSGIMELILVAPLSPDQIIFGRLKGIWGQFLPAALLWFGIEQLATVSGLRGSATDEPAVALFAAAVFLAVPSVGLRCSLLPLPMLANWIITLALVALAPAVTMVITDFLIQYGGVNYAWFGLEFRIWVTIPCGIVSLALLNLLAYRELRRLLRGRRFQFSRPSD